MTQQNNKKIRFICLPLFRKLVNQRWMISIVFAFSILAFNSLFHVLYSAISEATLRSIYLDRVASICAALINLLTPHTPVRVYQNTLISAKANLEVAGSCSGANLLFLLSAAILAFSAPFKRKIQGLILSFVLVFVINLLRILSLYFVMTYQPHWFAALHLNFAPTLTVITCCLFFTWWVFAA
jgi:exosortase family protein XrtM